MDIDGLMSFALEFEDTAVDSGPKRLHQIVGEAERIEAIVVLETERRMQPRCTNVARNGSPQHGVPVIQQAIRW